MKKILSSFIILIIILPILNTITLPIQLRFQDASLNYLTIMVLLILIPLSIFIRAFFSKKKTILMTIAIAISLPSFILFIFVKDIYDDIKKNYIDLSFQLIQEISKNQQYYRLYLTDGGATTAQGLVLRKEINLALGLKSVSPIFSKYKAKDATLKFISSHKLQIEIKPYSKGDKTDIREINI